MAYLLQQPANAIPLAALYAALAFGYSLAFGVTKRADITYGAIFAFAGQILLLFTDFGYNRLWLILPAALAFGAVPVAGLCGGGRGLDRPLDHAAARPPVCQHGHRCCSRHHDRPDGDRPAGVEHKKPSGCPPFLTAASCFWRDGTFEVTLTQIQLLNTVLMCAIIAVGALVMKRTSPGRVWRAVTDDPLAAELCGTSADRVFLVAYAGARTGRDAMRHPVHCLLRHDGFWRRPDVRAQGADGGGRGRLFGSAEVGRRRCGSRRSSRRCGRAYGPFLWRDLVVFSLLVLLLVLSWRERAIP